MPRLIALVAAGLVISAVPARAQIIAYDGFAYPTGNLNGQNGGIGFASGWVVASGTAAIQLGSMVPAAPSAGLPETGNSISLTPTDDIVPGLATRTLSTPVVGTAGTSLWVSVVMKGTGVTGLSAQGALLVWDGTLNGFSFTTGATGSGVPPNNPNPNSNWSLGDAGTGATEASSTVSDTVQSLMVAHLTFSAAGNPGSDQVDLYVNPPLTNSPPSSPNASMLVNHAATISTVSMNFSSVDGNTTSTLFDEIRLGHTFLDVTAVPEPSTLLLVSAAGIAIIARRRR